ncbi:unnamed protein product [Adineta steineri]|uniref:F-box domain-containing protein n=1 Tax=Adineta steineri TaxID=433720 RepID=A0A819QWL0_9BILA|nr:unnamed protein product [Adineta steineri]CAF1456345.1 unnamed protein product [Adineta steineri]CAF4037578.1 unnamed protein product [Adineta steineri]CAF4061705.1 unnamed protein product [Adineta steineri]
MAEITCFDHLSTEMIVEIFSYLSSNDLICSFLSLNKRFTDILLHYDQLIHNLQVPTNNLNFSDDIFHRIQSKIEHLTVTTNDLQIPWDSFSNLKSLTISSSIPINCDQFDYLWNSKQVNNLESFKLKSRIYSEEEYDSEDCKVELAAFTPLFHMSHKFKAVQYLSTVPPFHTIDTCFGMDDSRHLERLSLKLKSFGTIYLILQYCPNLKDLNLIVTIIDPDESEDEDEDELDLSNIPMRKFSLAIYNDIWRTFSVRQEHYLYLAKFLNNFSETLITLSLNFCGDYIITHSIFLLNGTQLQEELLQTMKELKNFHLYMACDLTNEENSEEVLRTFENSFWRDHNWTIGTHKNYFYTLPFHFSHFYGFTDFDRIQSKNSNTLEANHRPWDKIKTLGFDNSGLVTRDLIEQIRQKLPNLTTITSDQPEWQTQHSIKDEDYTNVTLPSVNTIHLRGTCLNDIQPWITYVLPNLKHLSIDEKILLRPNTELATLLNKNLRTLHIVIREHMIESSDFYPFDVKDLTITIIGGLGFDENNLQHILNTFTNFDILTVRFKCYAVSDGAKLWKIIKQVVDKLDINEINKNYQMTYSFNLVQFSRNTHAYLKRKLSKVD